MVNIPRALFSGRTGRQPLYHIAIEELQEWAYTGEPLVPLKGFPGVVWQRSKKKKRAGDDPFELGREEVVSVWPATVFAASFRARFARRGP